MACALHVIVILNARRNGGINGLKACRRKHRRQSHNPHAAAAAAALRHLGASSNIGRHVGETGAGIASGMSSAHRRQRLAHNDAPRDLKHRASPSCPKAHEQKGDIIFENAPK